MEHKRARQNVVLPQIGVRRVDMVRAVHEKLGFFLKPSAGPRFIFFIAYYLAEALKLVGRSFYNIEHYASFKSPHVGEAILSFHPQMSWFESFAAFLVGKNVAPRVKLRLECLALLCNDKHGLPKICKIELYAHKLLT